MTKKQVVLIHGWSTKLYNKNFAATVQKNIAWKEKKTLVKSLEENFELVYFNLPGFCGVAEPNSLYFDLEDFTSYFSNWLKTNKVKPFAVIGYSFGGAIALDYVANHHPDINVILISPALKRKESTHSKLATWFKFLVPNFALEALRNIYQIVFSRYYRRATPFLRKSYNKVVRRDIRNHLKKANKNNLLIIAGDSDRTTPFEELKRNVNNGGILNEVIVGGDHDICATHQSQVANSILNFLKAKK